MESKALTEGNYRKLHPDIFILKVHNSIILNLCYYRGARASVIDQVPNKPDTVTDFIYCTVYTYLVGCYLFT